MAGFSNKNLKTGVKVSLEKAAFLTGKSTKTLYRHMATGRVAYNTNRDGHREVDVSELQRVYGALRQVENESRTQTPLSENGISDVLVELTETLKKMQRRMDQQDALIADQQELIQHLQNRLEFKPAEETQVPKQGRPEDDPRWPPTATSMSDIQLRKQLREEYSAPA